MTNVINDDAAVSRRQHWIGLLARANGAALHGLVEDWGSAPNYERLRGPEVGLAMVRGRAGGTGASFNLGEMTVTRCSVRLADGTLGHAYVGGRDTRHCEAAAWLDALMQSADHQDALFSQIVEPLERAEVERRALAARKAAATRVEFFTMAKE